MAIVKKDEILAFCEVHALKLISSGVNLRVLSEIYEEMNNRKEAVNQERWARERAERERAFIQELKG